MISISGFEEYIAHIMFKNCLAYAALQETVEYLLSIELPKDFSGNLVVPEFFEKIAFNGLTDSVSNWLKTGSYQEGYLLPYFNNCPGINAVLQKKFHGLYEQSKLAIDETQDSYSDRRFLYILDKACVNNKLAIQACVLILMAHYFSSCDIFEEPQSN